MFAAVVMFAAQIYYYLVYYARIPKYRNDRRGEQGAVEQGISVIVLLSDNQWYLENILPKLLTQEYPQFEIVVVNLGSDDDFSEELALLKERYPNLSTTKIELDQRFPLSNKMAYNVGIKAASYENIILTTADAHPVSPKWLSCMARGFANGEVVIGYCGVERRKGLANKIIRCSRLMVSVRYLAAAIKGRPYRGMIHNLGFTRKLYFAHRGFDHLDMNLGEDDLFVQRIATRQNTSIVMNPHAAVKQAQWGGLGWWWQRRRFFSSTFRYYPRQAKNPIQWELGSRMLFYAAVATLAAVMPFEIQMGAAGLWLVRVVLVRLGTWKIRRRLNEGGLGWAMLFYDIIAPLTETILSIARRIKPAAGVWR